MKKKIALLLAGAMTLSSLPVNVFASNTTTNVVASNAAANTVVGAIENHVTSPVVAAQHTALRQQGVTGSGTVRQGNNARYYAEGRNFTLRFPGSAGTAINPGDPIVLDNGPIQIEIILNNAVWNFGEIPNQLIPAADGGPTWNDTTNTLTMSVEGAGNVTLQATPNTNRGMLTITGIAPQPAATISPATVAQALTNMTTVRNNSATDGAIARAITDATADVPNITSPLYLAIVNANGSITAIPTTDPLIPVPTDGEKVNLVTTVVTNLIDDVEAVAALDTNNTHISAFENAVAAYESELGGLAADGLDTGALAQLNTYARAIVAPATSLVREAEGRVPTTPIDPVDAATNLVAIGTGTGTVANATTGIGAATQNLIIATHGLVPGHDAQLHIANAMNAANTMNETLRVATATNVQMTVINATQQMGEVNRHAQLALDALGYTGPIAPPTTANTIVGGTQINVPLIVRTTSNDPATVTVGQASNLPTGIRLARDTRAFTIPTEAGVTTTMVPDPQTARDILPVENITVQENRVAALPATGAFELVAPSGYEFRGINDATVRTNGGITAPANAFTVARVGTDNRVVRVSWENLVPSTAITGSIVVDGLSLVSSNTNDNIREGEVHLEIRNVAGQTNVVRNQRFLAGTISEWNMTLTAVGEVPELVNGRLDGPGVEDFELEQGFNNTYHQAVTVRVEEAVADSWAGQRSTTFTLPEEVNVLAVEFSELTNVEADEFAGTHFNGDRTANVRVNENEITIVGLETDTNNRASFEMDLWLSIEPGFEGDIELEIGGSALNNRNRNNDNNETLVIAEAVNPVTVKTEVTSVRVGYQFVDVANFTITENFPGALVQGEEVYISIVDDANVNALISDSFNYEVTSGDIRVRNVSTSNRLGENNQQGIRFIVQNESRTASTIEFTNVQIRNNTGSTSAPTGAVVNYDLVVWGPAVANNYQGLHDTTRDDRDFERTLFETAGIHTAYVRADQTRAIVSVVSGSNQVTVGTETRTMDTAPYVSAQTDSMMVPVRFISEALGYNVDWNPNTAVVTITVPATANREARTIVFTTGTSQITINGETFEMVNANGDAVYSEIVDNRAFIPFRALGYALNVHVSWNAATATASFDPNRAYDTTDVMPVR